MQVVVDVGVIPRRGEPRLREVATDVASVLRPTASEDHNDDFLMGELGASRVAGPPSALPTGRFSRCRPVTSGVRGHGV